jgi:hypothetical protein
MGANVPSDGGTVRATLPRSARVAIALASRIPFSFRLPGVLARALFANGMSRELRAEVTAGLVPEAGQLVHAEVPIPDLTGVRRSWILTTRDRAVPPALQRIGIANLGGVDEVIELDAAHNAMFSHPAQLAEILLAAAGPH